MKRAAIVVLVVAAPVLVSLYRCGGGGGEVSGPGSDGHWDSAIVISDNSADSIGHLVALDNESNAMAVLRQLDGTIRTRFFSTTTGWGALQRLDSGLAPENYPEAMGFHLPGNAILIGGYSDGAVTHLWSARFSSNQGWDNAQLIETDISNYAQDATLLTDQQGNALAVWGVYQKSGPGGSIMARKFTQGAGWEDTLVVAADNSDYLNFPAAAGNSSGKAVVVWQKSNDGTGSDIWASYYTPAGGWSGAILVENDNTSFAGNPRISMDSEGNAIAVWSELNGTTLSIMANRYTEGNGWGTSRAISVENTTWIGLPVISSDSGGNAIVLWRQSNHPQPWAFNADYHIWSNRYDKNTGWGTAQMIGQNDFEDADSQQLAVDPEGNAIAVWTQVNKLVLNDSDDRQNIWTNRYLVGKGWQTPKLLENLPGMAAFPIVAADPHGNAFAMWTQIDSSKWKVFISKFVKQGM